MQRPWSRPAAELQQQRYSVVSQRSADGPLVGRADGCFMPGCHPSVAVLPLLDSQSTFWALFKRRQRHQRKDVSINSVLTATATAATARNYGNGTTERQNGNGRVETRH